jgi:hypothetical protein
LLNGSCSTPGASPALSALGAESTKDKFTLAKDSFAEELRFWIRHVVPLDVFDFAATIADEMMMTHAFCVVTRGAAFHGNFADQAGFHQVAKIVVGGGARGARINAVYGFESFRSGRVAVVIHQEGHHRETLGSTTQAFVLEAALDLVHVH